MSTEGEPDELRDVLLIGVHADPGITSHLRTYGLTYQAKALTSSHKNWAHINRLLEAHSANRKGIAIAKITEYNLFSSLLPQYEPHFRAMIELIPRFKHVAYVYDGALAGDFTCFKEDA